VTDQRDCSTSTLRKLIVARASACRGELQFTGAATPSLPAKDRQQHDKSCATLQTSGPNSKHRAVFFDRDGTLILDHGYLSSPHQVEFAPGALDVLRTLQEHGFLLVIVSNQSGIGRGLITEKQAEAVDKRFRDILAENRIRLAGVYYCPHAPDAGCGCRKPEPGLLRRAADELEIDLTHSYMVGDKRSDCEAGLAVGCRAAVLIGYGQEPAGCIRVSDLRELPSFVLCRRG
jgi:D-glycero-D-manno-heptose 1,7-bisphosphate phosphatase